MKSIVRGLILAGWGCVAGSGALAQVRPVPLDTVRVEVNSRASPLLGTGTRAVEVIDRETIRGSPARTVTEALEWAVGVDLMPRSPALVDVGIRGSSFEQVLVLVDGVRVRDAQTGHFNLNLVVPLEQVERIEVLRGPASALYGSDAMAGVINVVTRKEGNGWRAAVARGSFASTDAAIALARANGSARVDASGEFQLSDGHRPGTDYEMLGGRVGIEFPLLGRPLVFDVGHARRDFGASGFYGPYPSFESTVTTTATLRYPLVLDSTASVEPAVNYRRNSDDFILFRENPAAYRNRHTTDHVGGELIGRMALSDRLRGAVGVHAMRDEIRSSAFGDHSEWSAAASVEVAAGSRGGSSATVGVRADRLPTGDFTASPGASLAWRIAPGLRVRSSAGRSFRSPTWTERYYQDPANVGSPDLRRERAWSAEIGVDLIPAPMLRLSTTVFTRRASDLIDWAKEASDQAAPWMTRNVESADFRGLELGFTAGELAGFRLGLTASWLSLDSSAEEGFISKYALRPEVETYTGSLERDLGGLTTGLRAVRDRRAGESAVNRLDSRVSVRVRNARIWGDLRNVLDAEYQDITFNPAPGRSFWLGLELRGESPP